MTSAEVLYARRSDILEAELGDELVALDVEGGNCFGFNAPATEIWRLLEKPLGLKAICEALLEQYDVSATECELDVRLLIEDLQRAGLIVESHANGDRPV